MGTSQTALTAHLVMPQGHADDAFLQNATEQMHDQFEITHVTLQVMQEPFTAPCGQLPASAATTKPSMAVAHDHDHADDHDHAHAH
jgi:cobalt-zinc-cadmium efflux system protein